MSFHNNSNNRNYSHKTHKQHTHNARKQQNYNYNRYNNRNNKNNYNRYNNHNNNTDNYNRYNEYDNNTKNSRVIMVKTFEYDRKEIEKLPQFYITLIDEHFQLIKSMCLTIQQLLKYEYIMFTRGEIPDHFDKQPTTPQLTYKSLTQTLTALISSQFQSASTETAHRYRDILYIEVLITYAQIMIINQKIQDYDPNNNNDNFAYNLGYNLEIKIPMILTKTTIYYPITIIIIILTLA